MSLNPRARRNVNVRAPALLGAALLASLAACDSSDPVGPDDTGGAAYDSLTVDASADWAFVGQDGEGLGSASVADPTSSEDWMIGFFATSVMLNGGAAGPAGIVGHCLCGNAGATDAEVMAMSAESELAGFEAVTAADVPAGEDAWESDALAPAIDGWYSYDFATHTVSAAPENVWKVRTASGEAYAKFHVTDIVGATQQHAGAVTFEYALQVSAGAAFEPTTTATVDVAAGPVHFDLETGAEVAADADWDLLFEGYDVRVNGGVSGEASAGASLSGESFADVTDASDLMAGHYAGDAYGGVFDAHPWYRYNLDGGHQIWPVFNVYLVRVGEEVFKVQIVGYYGPTGESRHITFRYQRL